MSVSDLPADGFSRVKEVVHQVLDGLTVEDLCFRADRQANSIGWLIWHLSRVQDDHIADAAGMDQVCSWGAGSSGRAAVRGDGAGYGQNPAEVSKVRL